MRAAHVAAQRGCGATAVCLQAQPLLKAIRELQEQIARIEARLDAQSGCACAVM